MSMRDKDSGFEVAVSVTVVVEVTRIEVYGIDCHIVILSCVAW